MVHRVRTLCNQIGQPAMLKGAHLQIQLSSDDKGAYGRNTSGHTDFYQDMRHSVCDLLFIQHRRTAGGTRESSY